MKTKFIYVILAALLIGSQTISAQNKDNKTNKQRPPVSSLFGFFLS